MKARAYPALAVAVALAFACSDAGDPPAATPKPSAGTAASPSPPPREPEPVDLAAQGRQAYLSNCIACHNPDPKLEGALGPAVAGASAELIEARVMRGEYPAGYTPKRDTRAMIPMPFLQAQIPALAAYLESEGS